MYIRTLALAALSLVATAAGAQDIVPDTDVSDEALLQAAQNQQRTSQVPLSEDNMLVGQLGLLATNGAFTPFERVDVMLARGGEIVERAKPGPNGVFQMPAEPGVYSLIAYGPEGMYAGGVHVVPHDPGGKAGPVPIQAGGIPEMDIEIVKIVARYRIPASAMTVEPAVFSPEAVQIEEGVASSSLRRHSVQLSANGTLSGIIRSMDSATGRRKPAEGIDVLFVQRGFVLAQGTTGADGVFEVNDLQPGVYSMISVGPTGFGASAIDVRAPAKLSQRLLPDGTQFANFQEEGIGTGPLEATLILEEDLKLVPPLVGVPSGDPCICEDLAGGEGGEDERGGGGGMAGGSGVAGGGGSFLPAALAGGAAGLIGALAGDDGDDGVETRVTQETLPASNASP